MKGEEIQAILLGLLYVRGDEGIEVKEAADILETSESEADAQLTNCQAYVETRVPGLQIHKAADKYRLVTDKTIAPYLAKLTESPVRSKLSQAALETLAIIAYNQPIGRAEIDDIRGVKSEKAIQTLANKKLISEAGRAASIGRPILYQTTVHFLEAFHVTSLEELPPLSEDATEESALEAEQFFQSLEGET
ncbi:SMC-Scp complex subunit ScpB [Bacillus piscicola]|uniref:SMC-Scp complex subunit ScpB n=1 Tax=Bacillus piscicola TaxID=1632684 RepID=UPI001F09A14C|nr:SMC-Scp complex subunit ScpB [Bacillus piscicola]